MQWPRWSKRAASKTCLHDIRGSYFFVGVPTLEDFSHPREDSSGNLPRDVKLYSNDSNASSRRNSEHTPKQGTSRFALGKTWARHWSNACTDEPTAVLSIHMGRSARP